MKTFTNINEEKTLNLNKTQLYLLGIPYDMYKNYGQYKEDWESLSDGDIRDLNDTQDFLNSHMNDKTLRIPYNKLKPWFQWGIKKICEISLKHKEDLSKLDIKLYKEILDTLISYE